MGRQPVALAVDGARRGQVGPRHRPESWWHRFSRARFHHVTGPRQPPRQGRLTFPGFLARSYVVGGALLVLAAILFVIGAHQSYVPYQTLWTGVASMLGSVGLLSVIYEAFVKRSFVQDILRHFGVADRVQASGLVDVTHDRLSFPWAEYLAEAKWVDVVPIWLPEWLNSPEWSFLQSAACRRSLEIRLYSADSELVHGQLCDSAEVIKAATSAGTSWRSWGAQLNGESSLRVSTYRGFRASMGIIRTDRHVILQVGSMLRTLPDASTAVFCFANDPRGEFAKWVAWTVDNLPDVHLVELCEPKSARAATHSSLSGNEGRKAEASSANADGAAPGSLGGASNG